MRLHKLGTQRKAGQRCFRSGALRCGPIESARIVVRASLARKMYGSSRRHRSVRDARPSSRASRDRRSGFQLHQRVISSMGGRWDRSDRGERNRGHRGDRVRVRTTHRQFNAMVNVCVEVHGRRNRRASARDAGASPMKASIECPDGARRVRPRARACHPPPCTGVRPPRRRPVLARGVHARAARSPRRVGRIRASDLLPLSVRRTRRWTCRSPGG